jgi:diguanylate cyclase (GGDEF)-like protein
MLVEDIRFKIETSGVLVALAPVAALLVEESVLMLPLLVLPVLAVRRTAHLAALRERQSLRDPLTGLANRELFRRRLDRALSAAAPGEDAGVAVLMIDMDHFKDVNDTLGHHVGDELLCELARRIEHATRLEAEEHGSAADAAVARLGGDEFAVLLPGDVPADAAVRLADHLLTSLSRPMDLHGTRLSVQCSIGITTTGPREVDVHGLLKEADIALYEAKRERARYSVFRHGTVTGSAERLRMLPHLRDAIDAGRLVVHYQPQLDVVREQVVAVEALVRWDHPTEGLLGPDTFIDLAESAGLVARITTAVLDAALEAARHWRSRGWQVSVSVNLSARQLSDLALPGRVAEHLRRWDVPASQLTIEVTESSLMSDARQATAILRELRDMGVRLAIDDFGTGYSSLVLLQRLDVDEIKVDRSFVSGLGPGSCDDILVRSIIELGHNLGLRVVAEGVETDDVADRLRELGCDRLQGYLVGRPMAREAIDALIGVQQRWATTVSESPASDGADVLPIHRGSARSRALGAVGS